MQPKVERGKIDFDNQQHNSNQSRAPLRLARYPGATAVLDWKSSVKMMQDKAMDFVDCTELPTTISKVTDKPFALQYIGSHIKDDKS
ncbi:MAG: hypothetical protein ACREBS_03145 [Nitrososphaerales archaeon]